ncbi:hypothetical protein EW145_g1577 [Phellinidium pouzarii]|uniref:Diphthine--ammonia ligase n=1 Tax=Phellinidium pouzarii TaxID=167371 RepID=A0A4S4LEH9_9AGAM|nr:hypothetical protein EW145_g1577 [Phellinidium pouzarii]
MKYIALLSGGKDSCFNLVHCSKNGHELVAAASLGPQPGKEELDSYMYQTVGQDAIELVAKALDVPLYRKSITGSAIEQGSEYGTREAGILRGVKDDETEDLFELLSEVKNSHPDIQGVSVGAILSNYQRVRVEHVCLRLSLTPLCYLWQRNQDELLHEMIQTGLDAVLIKVAGIGLTTKHLGKTLAEMQPTLRRLNNLYGAHICGEGGEYETLTLDCPIFKRRLVLKRVETVIHSDNDFATVAYLRIKDAFLEDKKPIMESILAKKLDENLQTDLLQTTIPAERNDTYASVSISSKKAGMWVVVSNVQHEAGRTGNSIGEEVDLCFQQLRERLTRHGLLLSHSTFINVFISDISTFPEVNEAYRAFFGTSPPARACVAVDLPVGVNVRLDCIAFSEESPSERRALHVQSLSYWAPANIGPYSQAIIVGDRIFISGQIGLRPSTLTLPPTFALEIALSFQHVHRVLTLLQETYGTSWLPGTQCLICWLVHVSHVPFLQQIDEAEHSYVSVPTLFIGAKSLPKNAQLEAQVIVHAGQYTAIDNEEAEIRQCRSIFNKGNLGIGDSNVHWEVSTFVEISAFCAVVAVKGERITLSIERHPDEASQGNSQAIVDQLKNQVDLYEIWKYTYSVRLFHLRALVENGQQFLASLFSKEACPAVTEIPSRFIATKEADDWDFALCLIGSAS